MLKEQITVEITITAAREKIWEYWTNPQHIVNWNFASEDWICPSAQNDLKPGGQFNYRMEAKDGSMGFDFTGTYEAVRDQLFIAYKMSDDRNVTIQLFPDGAQVTLKESFDALGTESDEQQRAGWQAILNNFKKYVEEN